MATQVRTTPVRLKVSDKGKIAMCRAALQTIREQSAAGISSTGAPYPPGKGEKTQLNMRDTGRMLSDVEVYSTRITFKAPYAEIVDSIYHVFGISPQYQERFEELCQADPEVINGFLLESA